MDNTKKKLPDKNDLYLPVNNKLYVGVQECSQICKINKKIYICFWELFHKYNTIFEIYSSPFCVGVESAPEYLEIELIEYNTTMN